MEATTTMTDPRTIEQQVFEVCKLAAAAGDMAHHGHSGQAIHSALCRVTEAAALLPPRDRFLANQDAAAIYSTHAMHKVRGSQAEFTICHICGDGIPD